MLGSIPIHGTPTFFRYWDLDFYLVDPTKNTGELLLYVYTQIFRLRIRIRAIPAWDSRTTALPG